MCRRHSSGPGRVFQGEGVTGGESGVQGREGMQSKNTLLHGRRRRARQAALDVLACLLPFNTYGSSSFKTGVLVSAEELGDILIAFAVGPHKVLKQLTT